MEKGVPNILSTKIKNYVRIFAELYFMMYILFSRGQAIDNLFSWGTSSDAQIPKSNGLYILELQIG